MIRIITSNGQMTFTEIAHDYMFPENGLHPLAQRKFAESLNNLYGDVIIVTFSDVIIATLQLRIARGELKPSDVEVTVKSKEYTDYVVTFDNMGRPTSPMGTSVVTEIADEMIKIRRISRVGYV